MTLKSGKSCMLLCPILKIASVFFEMPLLLNAQ